MTSEGRTAGILCLVNVSEPCLECRIHVDAVLAQEPPHLKIGVGGAAYGNHPWTSLFQFTYSLLDRIHAWPGTYYLDLSIFIFPVLYIRTTRTRM